MARVERANAVYLLASAGAGAAHAPCVRPPAARPPARLSASVGGQQRKGEGEPSEKAAHHRPTERAECESRREAEDEGRGTADGFEGAGFESAETAKNGFRAE